MLLLIDIHNFKKLYCDIDSHRDKGLVQTASYDRKWRHMLVTTFNKGDQLAALFIGAILAVWYLVTSVTHIHTLSIVAGELAIIVQMHLSPEVQFEALLATASTLSCILLH